MEHAIACSVLLEPFLGVGVPWVDLFVDEEDAMRELRFIFIVSLVMSMLLQLPLLFMLIGLGGLSIYTVGLYLLASCILALVAFFHFRRGADKPVKMLVTFDNRGLFIQNVINYLHRKGYSYEQKQETYRFYPDEVKMSPLSKKMSQMIDHSKLIIILELYDDKALAMGTAYNRLLINNLQNKCSDIELAVVRR